MRGSDLIRCAVIHFCMTNSTQGRPPSPDTLINAVLADYRDRPELTIAMIAERHNVSVATVNKWARAAGFKRRSLRAARHLVKVKPAPDETWSRFTIRSH